MPDFRVTSRDGRLQVLPVSDRAASFAAQRSFLSFLRFLRAAHDAGLVVA